MQQRRFPWFLQASLLAAILLTAASTAASAQVTITPTHKLTTDALAFGSSLSIAGNRGLIGAPSDTVEGAVNRGSAYLFDLSTGQQLRKFIADDGMADDYFGIAVALSNNAALIGAFLDDIGANSGQGSAYIFDPDSPSPPLKITANDSGFIGWFGTAVALSGNRALVGAAVEGPLLQGSAYLFDVTTGIRLSKFVASDGSMLDNFGSSVGLSEKYALVGAPSARFGSNSRQGAAYLYDRDTGTQLAKFSASDGLSGAGFGGSISLLGNLALIGATGNSRNIPGAAYLFDLSDPNNIVELAKLPVGTVQPRIFISVALSGSYALVGAPQETVDGNAAQGAAYLFDISDLI